MAAKQNFKLDTSDVLGFNYRNWISKQKAKAISKPQQYFEDRDKLMNAIKNSCITSTYDTLFDVLNEGTVNGGGTTYNMDGHPKFPPQKINDILINICTSLAEDLEEVVDIVFPSDFERIADSRLLLQTKAKVINVGGATAPSV